MPNTLTTIPPWLENSHPILTKELTVETKLSQVSKVLSWLEEICPANISPRLWFECQTVIIEGFDNAVKHAHHGLASDTLIKLYLRIYSQGIEMEIWDQGKAFDLISVLQKAPEKVGIEMESGRGLIIIRKILDYIAYTRHPDGRNCLQMVKQFQIS
jgi:anti-sigma regulatory factor (Ser/Thr protein kinase)